MNPNWATEPYPVIEGLHHRAIFCGWPNCLEHYLVYVLDGEPKWNPCPSFVCKNHQKMTEK